MAKLNVNQIRERAKQIVLQHRSGIRFADLVQAICAESPENGKKPTEAAIWDLASRFPDLLHKPSRGLYVPSNGDAAMPPPAPVVTGSLKESEYYQLFGDWLTNELDEATVAMPLGGAGFQKKWGTPDVVGVYKPLASHRIKFDLEIVSAEIKIDPYQPVVAFGQAAAYRLFSAKSYIVMPTTISPEDYGRLESLCILFGIGLVLFDGSPADVRFQIRVRAQRFSPDMFYVNEFAERLFQLDAGVFNQLFG